MNATSDLDTARELLRGLRIPRTNPSKRYPDDDPLLRFDPAFGLGSDGRIYLNAQREDATLNDLRG